MVLLDEPKSAQDFQKLVNSNKDKLLLVMFYAPWCGYCKKTKPVFKKMLQQSEEFTGTIMNGDRKDMSDITAMVGVEHWPWFVAVSNGLYRPFQVSSRSSVEEMKQGMLADLTELGDSIREELDSI